MLSVLLPNIVCTVPESVTEIGESAFDGCTSLTDVYYIGTEEQWGEISIGSNNESLTDANIHYGYTTSDNPIVEPKKLTECGAYADKIAVTAAREDDKLTVAIDIDDNTVSADEVQVFAAEYDGKTINSVVVLTATKDGDTLVFSGDVNADDYKIMVWDKTNSPITYVCDGV
jgi:hypothetical protein